MENALKNSEIYLGRIDGQHVTLMPDQVVDLSWEDAHAWARSCGGDLPTRAELAALDKHPARPTAWSYWSSELRGDDMAWLRSFSMGREFTTYLDHKDLIRACAVRREQVRG